MDRLEAFERADESEHCLSPAEAFALVGDETRVTILEALWNVADPPVPFSTLYDLSETDSTARFNYHLNQLTGHFVRKTAQGYELRTAGENVVRAVVEGSFNAHPDIQPFDTGDACTQCGEHLMARYEDEQLAIDCPACGQTHGVYGFPPGGLLGRDDDEILTAFDRRVRHRHSLASDGVCPDCSGRMQTELSRHDGCSLDTGLRAAYTCEQCQQQFCSPIGLAVLDRPAVVSFHRDHDIDIARRPYWRLDWCVTDERLHTDSTDPWRLTVAISVDKETLSLTLDGSLRVVASERDTTPMR
jgi:hypothetical protein